MPDPSVNFFRNDPKSAYEALAEAQRIAFAPIVFQACRVLRNSGVLERVQRSGSTGMTLDDAHQYCFSQNEIVSFLKRVARSLAAGGTLYILELFWDRQPNETAAFCLQQTSLHFACIANGNSQMYHSADMLRCLEESGLELVEESDQVGLYHTLFKCRRA